MSHSSEKSEVSYIYILPSDGRGWTNNSSWLLYYIGKNHSIFIRERQSKSPWRYSYLYTIYTHTHVYIYVYIYFGLRFIRSPMSSLSLSLSLFLYTHTLSSISQFFLFLFFYNIFFDYLGWTNNRRGQAQGSNRMQSWERRLARLFCRQTVCVYTAALPIHARLRKKKKINK